MRIISGTLRGRQFAPPPGQHTRPTADRAKVALFNILTGRLPGAQVLDGFAGSGALSFESLSRGARHCVLFERDREAARLLRQNAETLGLAGAVEIREADFLSAAPGLQGQVFDLVFLDPPYGSGLLEPALAMVGAAGLLSDRGILAAEHSSRVHLPESPKGLAQTDRRTYGAIGFTFYRKRGSDEDLGIPGQF